MRICTAIKLNSKFTTSISLYSIHSILYTSEFLLFSADENSKKPYVIIAEIWYCSKAIILNGDTVRCKGMLLLPKPEIFLTQNVPWFKGKLHGTGSFSKLHSSLIRADLWVEWC